MLSRLLDQIREQDAREKRVKELLAQPDPPGWCLICGTPGIEETCQRCGNNQTPVFEMLRELFGDVES